MFGQHDDKPKGDDDTQGGKLPHTPDEVVAGLDAPKPPENNDAPSWAHPGGAGPAAAVIKPSNDDQTNATEDKPSGAPTQSDFSPASPPPTPGTDDLIDIKQEALTRLSPLVGHLDQTPDEKFRTLMMMIQASDDQSLVKSAYDTALKIDDEKTRAQALLDIVNEINYFTQHSAKPE